MKTHHFQMIIIKSSTNRQTQVWAQYADDLPAASTSFLRERNRFCHKPLYHLHLHLLTEPAVIAGQGIRPVDQNYATYVLIHDAATSPVNMRRGLSLCAGWRMINVACVISLPLHDHQLKRGYFDLTFSNPDILRFCQQTTTSRRCSCDPLVGHPTQGLSTRHPHRGMVTSAHAYTGCAHTHSSHTHIRRWGSTTGICRRL